jgi:tetratricopeptide (TPR) repeat protein
MQKLSNLLQRKHLQINPKMAGPHHIMGRWHRVVAGFNAFEMAMISTFFGKGLEGGTYEDALKHFKKANEIEPLNPTHCFEMANTYLERDETGDEKNAKAWFQKTVEITPRSEDEKMVAQQAKNMITKLK